MAKSKYAPALFEVISKQDEKPSGGLPLPKWWRSKTASPSPAQTQKSDSSGSSPTQPAATSATAPADKVDPSVQNQTSQPAEANLTTDAPTSASQAQSPAVQPALQTGLALDPEEDRPPVVQVREGRIELSLNPTNAAIAAGIVLIGLFLAYQMGRGIGRPATPVIATVKATDELDAVRNGPATPAVLNVPSAPERRSLRTGARTSAAPTREAAKPATQNPAPANNPTPAVAPNQSVQVAPPPAPTPGQRVPGLTYVILETLKRIHRPEAEQIQQWLQGKRGIATTIEPSGDYIQLVSTQGFDYNNSTERARLEEFCQIVKGLGKQYKAEFGSKANYMMREPYGRKLPERAR